MKTKKAILHLGRDKWRELIAGQEASGSNISTYCRQQGVNKNTFYNWRKRLVQRVPKLEEFIEVKPVGRRPEKILSIETPRGYRLEIEPGTERSYVQSILVMLAGLG